ncbi:aminotransferase class I/II-fold pyridoxal phosphate-dependent enzyme [Candidatus Bathyarchaeota archaeon A05DMB-2]|jgi:threonine aldolase|nr:aminotransferase class I/II-fold pyridoxal phosphate-dependent enzyme [Candidatus Bathyarchaeota archaeon A05DMB-2]
MPSKEIIDLRSDTVTLPTEEMLEAIRHAELGDDVFGEDPTVNRLEEMAAEKMGKEAALLVTSGTQANLVSLMSNTKRGELVILEAESHIYWYEVGGISMIAGLLPWPLKSSMGALDPKDVEAAIRPKNIHFPEPALVCIENTHNRHGGTIITPEQIRAISEVAVAHGLKLYMDGARIFNAAVALNVDVKEFTRHVDNLMFCLSKSLSCPIGSLVVGTQEFIEKARKIRKVLGGGMRQAGIIAAPGIVALEKMIDRLKEDHENAKRLAEGIAKIDGVTVDMSRVQTNMVCFDISCLRIEDDLFLSKLEKEGILALTNSKNVVRMVTHRGIEKNHIEKTIAALEKVSSELRVG